MAADIEKIRDYCLAKAFVTECFPFDNDALVFKVFDKMFALLSLSNMSMNLKCSPGLSVELRENYYFVSPGYHMNKNHWNTIQLSEISNNQLLMGWIDHSYWLVVSKLPKIKRMQVEHKMYPDNKNGKN